MGRAVKDLGAVKLLNNPSPKSKSPKKGLLSLALDLGILGVIDFWKSHFLTKKPGLDFDGLTIWGCFPTPDDCLQASWQGPFFSHNNTSLEFYTPFW